MATTPTPVPPTGGTAPTPATTPPTGGTAPRSNNGPSATPTPLPSSNSENVNNGLRYYYAPQRSKGLTTIAMIAIVGLVLAFFAIIVLVIAMKWPTAQQQPVCQPVAVAVAIQQPVVCHSNVADEATRRFEERRLAETNDRINDLKKEMEEIERNNIPKSLPPPPTPPALAPQPPTPQPTAYVPVVPEVIMQQPPVVVYGGGCTRIEPGFSVGINIGGHRDECHRYYSPVPMGNRYGYGYGGHGGGCLPQAPIGNRYGYGSGGCSPHGHR